MRVRVRACVTGQWWKHEDAALFFVFFLLPSKPHEMPASLWPRPQGRTPLHDASFKGHTDVVQLLLQHEADPTATDCDVCHAHKYTCLAAALHFCPRLPLFFKD